MKALIGSELKQRMRGRRWWVLLALWLTVLFGLVALVRAGAKRSLEFSPDPDLLLGPIMFGSLALFVLALISLIVPSLTSTSINGERDRGTLAVLQATLYRPMEILGAKFLAAFVTAAAFVATTFPLALWCFSEGDVGLARALVVYAVLLVACALFIAIGLASSALVRRPALSAMAAYACVFVLTLGSPILYGLSLLTAPEETREVTLPGGERSYYYEQRIGARWLLLAPNPFVILADAAPRSSSQRIDDPLSAIREGARTARRGPQVALPGYMGVTETPAEPPPLWPTGLVIDAALTGLAGYVVLRKLHVPARRLGTGERVA